MKTGFGIAAVMLAAGAALGPAGAARAAEKPVAPDLENLPDVVFDDSIGDWVVDRFAGNNTAGTWFYQGPAREVGGLQRPGVCVEATDGTMYLTCGLQGGPPRLLKVTSDGALRLLMEAKGLIEGPMEQCRAGIPVWNPKETALYLTGPNCLRKVVERPDGSRWVEVVAGIPNKEGRQDGPAKEATLQGFYRGVVCNSRGTFFWLEDGGLRRIENGAVASVPLKRPEPPPLFNFAMGSDLLSLGEDDDTLYISDFYSPHGYGVLRCDLRSGELTRVCGISRRSGDPHKRAGRETDGPALTHVGFNSGARGRYHAFYNALWIWGPDHLRFRWLRLDGDSWVRTAFAARRPETKAQPFGLHELNSLGIPGEQFRLYLCTNVGVDSRGGVFIAAFADQSGFWRAYNKNWPASGRKEAKP